VIENVRAAGNGRSPSMSPGRSPFYRITDFAANAQNRSA
jgi:hypothetical protein